VTLVGYTSHPKAEEHQVKFDADENIIRGYRGKGWHGIRFTEGPGEVVWGEAVRIIKKSSELF